MKIANFNRSSLNRSKYAIIYTIGFVFLFLFACTPYQTVKKTKQASTDISVLKSKFSTSVEDNWRLLTSALTRIHIPVVVKNEKIYYINTDWITFKYDKKKKSASLQEESSWLSDVTRERHRFELSLQLESSENHVLIQVVDSHRQVEVDLAAHSAMSYLQWRDAPVLQGSAEAFLQIIQEAMAASNITTLQFTEPAGNQVRDVTGLRQRHGSKSKALHVKTSKETLWKAIQATLKSQKIQFVADPVLQTIDIDWVVLEWDDKKQQLKQPVDKEPLWAFNVDGVGMQQHRFNLQVHQDINETAYVIASHRGWREQFDATPDASVTMLKWEEKTAIEEIAEAFLNFLSIFLSIEVLENSVAAS